MMVMMVHQCLHILTCQIWQFSDRDVWLWFWFYIYIYFFPHQSPLSGVCKKISL